MLKFIKHHMTGIIGIEIYPVIAFALFFTFFLGMLWYVLTTHRNHIHHMERMPMADGTLDTIRPDTSRDHA